MCRSTCLDYYMWVYCSWIHSRASSCTKMEREREKNVITWNLIGRHSAARAAFTQEQQTIWKHTTTAVPCVEYCPVYLGFPGLLSVSQHCQESEAFCSCSKLMLIHHSVPPAVLLPRALSFMIRGFASAVSLPSFWDKVGLWSNWGETQTEAGQWQAQLSSLKGNGLYQIRYSFSGSLENRIDWSLTKPSGMGQDGESELELYFMHHIRVNR